MDPALAITVEGGEHFHQVLNVVVEPERSGGQRRHTGVGPVRNVDVAVRQQGFHSAAQERGVMARHGRHNQQPRLLRVLQAGLGEVNHTAVGLLPHHLFRDIVN